MAGSLFKQLGSVVQGGINAEKLARQAADLTLQANIDAEATARQTAISAEATARQAADTALQTSINTKLDATATAADSTKLAGVAATNYIRYFQQAVAPVAAVDGSIWKDTDDGKLYMAANDGGVLSWFGI